jgi:hypothetical protein
MIECLKSDGGRGDLSLLPSGKQQRWMWSSAIAGVGDGVASCSLAFLPNPHVHRPAFLIPKECARGWL